MTGIYNLSILFYILLIKALSPFNKKAALWTKGRRDIFIKLQEKFHKNNREVIWFHCASLGEFEQARTVIEAVKKEYPSYRLLVTFFSPSGYEIRKGYKGADDIFYLPADTKKNAITFLSIVNPKIILFVKYEFWFHYLNESKKRKIPTLLFSAIFRKGQPFFSNYTSFYRNILASFTWLFVQDVTSVELLKTIGFFNASNTGDTRFDRVRQLSETTMELPIARAFKNSKKTIILGSAWKEDMEVLIPFINQSELLDIKFIIAPHEINEIELKSWQQKFIGTSILYSKATENNVADKQLLLIDNIGMLSSLYQYGDFAWIGGGFGKGLHNILEAATFGMPIYFGTNYKKFKEAKDLIKEGAAFSIKDSKELSNLILPLLEDEQKRLQLAQITKQFIQNNIGATKTIMDYLSHHHTIPTQV